MKPPLALRSLGSLGVVLLFFALFWPPGCDAGAEETAADGAGYDLVRQLLDTERPRRRAAAEALAEAGDLSLLPAMVDAFFFTPRAERKWLQKALESLAGERPGREYHDWVEWLGARDDIVPREDYAVFKLELLKRIDPRYKTIFYPGAPMRIRFEEVIWGGVRLDGIPSLDDPPVVAAAEAKLRDGERIFGVSLGGESRAYPLRYLSWHEMLNDSLGGQSITLSYCTLCGSGVLFATDTPAGGAYRFGTSGLLYRSNKLMFDRQGYSLWSNLTGEPVIGRRARGSVRLEVLPLTLTTWKSWRRHHPETTVIAPDAEAARRSWGFDYQPGVADRARAGVSFPVWQASDALGPRDEVYAVRLGGVAKAWALEAVIAAGVVNDHLGDRPVVLVADSGGGVRAYLRGPREFRSSGDERVLLEGDGGRWRLDEVALVPPEDLEVAADESFERLGGHVAFWLGWYGQHPETEVWVGGR